VNSVFLRDSTAISDSILLLFGGCIKQGGLVCSFALLYGKSYFSDLKMYHCMKGRPGAVVRDVSLSNQVVDSKQPLRRFCGEGMSRFIPFPDPTHVGASGTGSTPFFKKKT